MNKFTKILQSKGWTVESACKHWQIRSQTYYRRVNDKTKHQQLLDMCRGIDENIHQETN